LILLVAAQLVRLPLTAADAAPTHKLATISLRKYADSLRLLIIANRETYARLTQPPAPGPEAPHDPAAPRLAHGLPDPDRMLRMVGRDLQARGAEFSFVLRSRWPISTAGSAQTETEETALERVLREPDQPVYANETLGGRSYFTAAYADRATLASCVACHNRNADSPRHDFQIGDVMGVLVVRVPLEF
jgi:cytochrome c553